ncbi:MAG: ester cyclase [Candidatus Aminicenantes bacterium]|nr:MAG: ester cyclase [Candidatus Aminicenantes bacterium]
MQKLYVMMPLVVLISFISGCQNQAEEGITQEAATAITAQILKIWNEGDLALADELYDPGYVRHHPTPLASANLDEFKNTVISNRTLFPDYNLVFDEMIVKGNRILVFASVTGTNSAPLGEIHATDKKIHMSGIYVYLIANGKIAEEWTYFNLLSYYQQLGFTLASPQQKESEKQK